MKQLVTTAIVLTRTDYGEADRIVTMLTPDHGKLRLMAKGVRRMKSRMAGGIELFSTSNITYLQGRSGMGTLISTRLSNHYGNIVHNIDRVQAGYELIKTINKVTEDQPEQGYFELLEHGFVALDDKDISVELIMIWFQAHLLHLAGYSPNLLTDTAGDELLATQKYNFDSDSVAFVPHEQGRFTATDIKVLRLLFSDNKPKVLNKIDGIETVLPALKPLVDNLSLNHLGRL